MSGGELGHLPSAQDVAAQPESSEPGLDELASEIREEADWWRKNSTPWDVSVTLSILDRAAAALAEMAELRAELARLRK